MTAIANPLDTTADVVRLPEPLARGTPRVLGLRRLLEEAIEAAVAILDAIDGDSDFENQCEDEGAQCDDEGIGLRPESVYFASNWPPGFDPRQPYGELPRP